MIAVLPRDPAPEFFGELRGALEARGWTWELSQGSDQSILAVAGPARPEELTELLPAQWNADVVPIHRGKHYRRLRRRRRMMHGIAWGLTLVIACGLGYPVVTYLGSSIEDPLEPQLVRAGKVDDLRPASAKLVREGGSIMLLARLEGERFFAVSAECTHMNDCLLEFDRERLQVVCPCHGGVWDLYGNVIAGPPSVPLRSYPITRVGDELVIRTGG